MRYIFLHIHYNFRMYILYEIRNKNKRVCEEKEKLCPLHVKEEDEGKFFIQIDCKLIKSAFTLVLSLFLIFSLSHLLSRKQQVDFLCLFFIADDFFSSSFLIFFSFIWNYLLFFMCVYMSQHSELGICASNKLLMWWQLVFNATIIGVENVYKDHSSTVINFMLSNLNIAQLEANYKHIFHHIDYIT